MNTSEQRSYKCKDEELSIICRNAMVYLKRDLVDFTAFSPIFNENYLSQFGEKINLVDELVSPKIETDGLKKITKRLYLTMDNLLEPIGEIRGYLFLAKKSIDISAKDFGLALLSRKISSRDAEGVRQNLLLLVSYLKKYQKQLTVVGFNNNIIEQLESAITLITTDNQMQFEIIGRRKSIVKNNLTVLNELYKQLTDILNIGKLIYKSKDPLKAKDYMFSSLMKSVRIKT